VVIDGETGLLLMIAAIALAAGVAIWGFKRPLRTALGE
jgi:hypothetical protein